MESIFLLRDVQSISAERGRVSGRLKPARAPSPSSSCASQTGGNGMSMARSVSKMAASWVSGMESCCVCLALSRGRVPRVWSGLSQQSQSMRSGRGRVCRGAPLDGRSARPGLGRARRYGGQTHLVGGFIEPAKICLRVSSWGKAWDRMCDAHHRCQVPWRVVVVVMAATGCTSVPAHSVAGVSWPSILGSAGNKQLTRPTPKSFIT